jgi:hypothetical protein
LKLSPRFGLSEDFLRLGHGLLSLEHGFEDRLSRLNLGGISFAKHAKLTHKATIRGANITALALASVSLAFGLTWAWAMISSEVVRTLIQRR